jgi:hypothetical protein
VAGQNGETFCNLLMPGSRITMEMPPTTAVWLVRPRADGGSDYVSFLTSPAGSPLVEVREGSHLPPQMPLLKRRRHLPRAEADACRRRLQQEAGYRNSDPLF